MNKEIFYLIILFFLVTTYQILLLKFMAGFSSDWFLMTGLVLCIFVSSVLWAASVLNNKNKK